MAQEDVNQEDIDDILHSPKPKTPSSRKSSKPSSAKSKIYPEIQDELPGAVEQVKSTYVTFNLIFGQQKL